MRDDITLEAGANELNVAMVPIAVSYEGTITKKELKYQLSLFNWTDPLTIPVSGQIIPIRVTPLRAGLGK